MKNAAYFLAAVAAGVAAQLIATYLVNKNRTIRSITGSL